MIVSREFDARVRRESMEWLRRRTSDGLDSIRMSDIEDFELDGQRFRLLDRQRGIWKPAHFDTALAIRTTYRSTGQSRPYDDAMGADGLQRYNWRGTEANHPENVGLRNAMHREVPLVWYVGVGPGIYQPIFPVYVRWEEPELRRFVVDPIAVGNLVRPDSPVENAIRRYITVEMQRRLHQPVFRATVMRAYQTRCAVCNLGHAELLDAAHIISDRSDGGEPVVSNGLALCKIHHAAFDSKILGIRPDLVVEIRRDLLEEIDGPMLKHGLQERHGQRLLAIPRSRAERPSEARLAIAYEAFQQAS